MKLLFDQNLSPRLPRLLADIYPESLHVREIGFVEAQDIEIWNYAKQIKTIEDLLRKHSISIHTFADDTRKSYLILP
jgi:predicted nuclease of predicted toxin-antitoxin system